MSTVRFSTISKFSHSFVPYFRILGAISAARCDSADHLDELEMQERRVPVSMRKVFPHAVPLMVLFSFLAGCNQALDENEFDENVDEQQSALIMANASYAGSTVTLNSGYNDSNWLVNQSDTVWADNTRLTATINHGGALLNGFGALGHIAIGIRGCSFDWGFQQMGLPLQTGTFLFGEKVQEDYAAKKLSLVNLHAMVSGRGITFWPRGTSHCADSTRPCAIFENFTANTTGGGLVPGSVALDVTSSPFLVSLSADNWDTYVKVIQGGITRADVSCRSISGNSPLCGPQAGDVAVADAFIAFVNSPAMAGRTVGATGIQVTHSSYPTGNY